MEYRRRSHSMYDLKYHIVFCTKYRYRVLTEEVANRAREIMREVCAANYVDIVSGSMSPDHVHMLLSIPPSISLSKIVQYVTHIVFPKTALIPCCSLSWSVFIFYFVAIICK